MGLPPSNQLYLEAKLPTPALLEVPAAAASATPAESEPTKTGSKAGERQKVGDSDIECESDTSDNGEPKQD